MSVRHWMVAGVLALAGIGSAMATDMDTHDALAGGHATAESSARDGSGSTGGDVLGVNRDTPSSRRGSDSEDENAGNSRGGGTAGGGEHGVRISAPTSARPAPVGWQSLLPGSIQ